jgi:hypothetical protein
LVRQRRYSLVEAGPHLDILEKEGAAIRAALDAAENMHERRLAYMESVRAMEQFIRDLRYDENDLAQRRDIIEHLVNRIEVYTNGQGREKYASLTVRWRVLPPGVVGPFNIPERAGRASNRR